MTGRILGIYRREAWAQILAVLRMPQFLIPSVALPVTFYAIFGIAFAKGNLAAAQWLLATYAIFAAVGPSMFGFGAGIATEREAGLIELKRASPMPAGAYVAGKLAAACMTALLALCAIAVVALLAGVTMPAWRWAAVLALGVASSVPFALIGLNVGLRLGAQAATAVANFLFLGFSVLGGLWFPLNQMPAWMGHAAWTIPSFHLAQLSLVLAGMAPARDMLAHVSILLAICAVAALGAWSAWRRDVA
ncbi:MAG TPA: ABC transporter permease [Allosphingosinicella sp.]|jgi:ABC-2 type transport system permease protein